MERKSVNKLRESIEASKQQPLWRLVNGFGIRHVGTQTAKDLVRHLDKLTDLFDYDAEKLTEIEGIGQIVASSITEFFHNPATAMITELETLGLNLVQEKQAGGGKLGRQDLPVHRQSDPFHPRSGQGDGGSQRWQDPEQRECQPALFGGRRKPAAS